jgi:hypothetical protein
MTLTGSGWSVSRERAMSTNKKSRRLSRSKIVKEEEEEYNSMVISSKLEDDMVLNVTPIASSSIPLQIESKGANKPLKRSIILFIEKLIVISVLDDIFYSFSLFFVSSFDLFISGNSIALKLLSSV